MPVWLPDRKGPRRGDVESDKSGRKLGGYVAKKTKKGDEEQKEVYMLQDDRKVSGFLEG
jgi:hypothetical protein